MNREVSSSQKTLKKYGPLRTHSGDIVSFRENKIGHRSSENGAMHDIDFGDVLSTPAPVAASVATKKTHKKVSTQLQTFFSARFSGFFHRFTELGARCCQHRSLCWGVPLPTSSTYANLASNFISGITCLDLYIVYRSIHSVYRIWK